MDGMDACSPLLLLLLLLLLPLLIAELEQVLAHELNSGYAVSYSVSVLGEIRFFCNER